MADSDSLQPPSGDAVTMAKVPSLGTAPKRFFDDAIRFGEEDVREALLSERKRHRLWREAVIQKMTFDQLEHSACIKYILESFTESRSSSDVVEAYSHEKTFKTHNDSATQNPWDYEVLPNAVFVDQTRVLELPGSSRVGPCSACHGDGSTHCFHCRGQGTDKCTFCRGTGMKNGVAHPAVYTHPMVASFPHADLSRGYMSSSTAMIRQGNTTCGVGTPMHLMWKTGVPPPGLGAHQLCFMCHGKGINECKQCAGGGKKQCLVCKGSGATRTFTRLIVHFETEVSECFTSCEIPPQLVERAEGKEIFSEERNYVVPLSTYPVKEVNSNSTLLCSKHLEKFMGRCRVIQQRHSLVAIPIVKVHYSISSQSPGTFWVYGNGRRCYIPNFPSKCAIL